MIDAGVHLYHMSTWMGTSGRWYCNDVTHMSGRSAKWYTPMRILDLSVEEYINLLLKFNAQEISYYSPTDCLLFSFNTEKNAKAFCSYVNKAASKRQYYCA